ncbi:MAG: PAS domain-containing protein [Potamolinea sp.]
MFSLNEQRMLYISPAYEKILGRSSQTLQEHPEKWLERIHPEDRDKIATVMYSATRYS